MSKSHMNNKGKWVACHASQRACPKSDHLPYPPEYLDLLPANMVELLLEAVTEHDAYHEDKFWYDTEGRHHRDGNLPAVIYNGRREFWRHGWHYRTDILTGGEVTSLFYVKGEPSPEQQAVDNEVEGEWD